MVITELYADTRPWNYYVDECGMKQESLDLMKRSIEFALIHNQWGVLTTLSFRKPLRDLPTGESAEWQKGWRGRLLMQIIDIEDISDSKLWFEAYQNMSKTCPSCFCPNLKEFFALSSNVKGFCCPSCGNAFDIPINSISVSAGSNPVHV